MSDDNASANDNAPINAAAWAAIAADQSIKPEARYALALDVSTAVGASTDPEAVGRAMSLARDAHPTWFVPPTPPVAQPGSLADIASRYMSRSTPAVGLTTHHIPMPLRPEDYRAPAAPPDSHQPTTPSVDGLVDFIAYKQSHVGFGLNRVDKPKP